VGKSVHPERKQAPSGKKIPLRWKEYKIRPIRGQGEKRGGKKEKSPWTLSASAIPLLIPLYYSCS
jgi:hypothetical protein